MNLTVSDEFLVEIGRVAILQSHIERCLTIIITNLTGVETPVGNALTNLFQFRQLATVATSLLELRKSDLGEHHAYVTNLISRADKTNSDRNAFIHSMWGFGANFDPTHASLLKLSRKSPPELELRAVSIEDVRTLVAEMEEILDGLTYIHPRTRLGTAAVP